MVVLGGGDGGVLMSEVPLHQSIPMRFVPSANEVANTEEQESSLLTTYWSESTIPSRPALRHGSLNSLFHVASYLPSWVANTEHQHRLVHDHEAGAAGRGEALAF